MQQYRCFSHDANCIIVDDDVSSTVLACHPLVRVQDGRVDAAHLADEPEVQEVHRERATPATDQKARERKVLEVP